MLLKFLAQHLRSQAVGNLLPALLCMGSCNSVASDFDDMTELFIFIKDELLLLASKIRRRLSFGLLHCRDWSDAASSALDACTRS